MPFENPKCEKMEKKNMICLLVFLTITFAEAATRGVI